MSTGIELDAVTEAARIAIDSQNAVTSRVTPTEVEMKTSWQILGFTMIFIVLAPALHAQVDSQSALRVSFPITETHPHPMHDEELRVLQSELETAMNQQAALEESSRSLRMKLLAQSRRHESHIDALEDSVSTRDSRITSLYALLADTTVAFITLQQSTTKEQLTLQQDMAVLRGAVDTLQESLSQRLAERLAQLESTAEAALAFQDSLAGVNRNFARTRSSLASQRGVLADLRGQLEGSRQESTDLGAARDSVQSANAALADAIAKIRKENRTVLRAFGITAIALLVALLVGAVVVLVRHNKEVPPTQSGIDPDLQALYVHYRRMSVVGRFAFTGGTGVTLFLVAFVALTIGFGSEGLRFLQGEVFWKTLAAVAAPIGFLLAAYSLIEQRVLEVTKLVTEARR